MLAAAVVAAIKVVGAVTGLLRWALMWKAAATAASLLSLSIDSYFSRRDEKFIRHAFSRYLEEWSSDRRAIAPRCALAANGAMLLYALQRAQAALCAAPETSHPVFWAPFVLIGDGDLTLGEVGT